MWSNELFGGSLFGTLKHGKSDSDALNPIAESRRSPIPSRTERFRSTRPRRSSCPTPITRRISRSPETCAIPTIPIARNLPVSASPRGSIAPPASMRSSTPTRRQRDPRFVINAQNCVHCKTCDIKDPAQNIDGSRPRAAAGRIIWICKGFRTGPALILKASLKGFLPRGRDFGTSRSTGKSGRRTLVEPPFDFGVDDCRALVP